MWIAARNQETWFPSSKVEMIWETHIELSGEYLEFSKLIFNRLFIPLPYSPFEKVNSD